MAVSVETTKPEQASDERQRLVDEAREMVVRDPEILGGTPVIKGTRVPVYTIAAWFTDGEPMEVILDSYPSVTEEQVKLSAIYAEVFPFEEKPYKKPELPPGAVLIYRKTVLWE